MVIHLDVLVLKENKCSEIADAIPHLKSQLTHCTLVIVNPLLGNTFSLCGNKPTITHLTLKLCKVSTWGIIICADICKW
jgi:hypothetical protein